MELTGLNIFPPYSLDTSILAAVLVGVIVLAALTETLGWVFVGLVVPGYLASVFIIHPEAGVTVVAEAVATYLVAVGLSRFAARTGAWSEFFGRDRFFLIVLASVLVRAVSEVCVLPILGAWLDERFGFAFTVQRTLHSIGLVLVPLTANGFWKLGLRRGLFQVGVPVAVTFALLYFVLLPATNLSFSSLELTYEDVAQSFLASPKAYILLLTTAVVAAAFNIRYGWDFNGILVPALLAVTFVEPTKVLATIVEVLLLVAGTKLLLSVPGLRTMNLEGPRKTLLVFTLGFFLKFALGWALGGRVPGLKVTDLFGFGYLVPTLLAVKILQKQVIARIVLATTQTSVTGFLLGSAFGFALSLIEPPTRLEEKQASEAQIASRGVDRTLLGVAALAHVTVREGERPEVPLPRRRGEFRKYEALWAEIGAFLHSGAEEDLRKVQLVAQSLGLDVQPLADLSRPGWVVREQRVLEQKVGWDTAVLFPKSDGPILEVPRPASEAPSAEGAAVLCERIACKALLISGVDTVIPRGDAVANSSTPLLRADRVLEHYPRVVVRGDGNAQPGKPVLHARENQAWLNQTFPEGMHLAFAPTGNPITWGRRNSSVLRVHPADLRALVAKPIDPAMQPLTGRELLTQLDRPAVGNHAMLTSAELLLLEQQILSPLVSDTPDAKETEARVAWSNALAQLMGLELRPVDGCVSANERCYLLTSRFDSQTIGVSVLVRPGAAPAGVEVPNGWRELGAVALGLEMWKAANARTLIVAEPSLDPEQHGASPGALRTAFQAAHQSLHRALPHDAGAIMQVRGYAGRPAANADVVVDLGTPTLEEGLRPKAVTKLFEAGAPFGWLKAAVRYHDGAPELAGLTDASPQRLYSRALGGPSMATMWFSASVRGVYTPLRRANEQLAAVGTQAPPRDVFEAIGADILSPPGGKPTVAMRSRFESLSASTSRYLQQHAVHELASLFAAGSARAYYSGLHGLPYVVVEARDGRRVLRGAFFMHEAPSSQPPLEVRAGEKDLRTRIDRALAERRSVIFMGELPAEARR